MQRAVPKKTQCMLVDGMDNIPNHKRNGPQWLKNIHWALWNGIVEYLRKRHRVLFQSASFNVLRCCSVSRWVSNSMNEKVNVQVSEDTHSTLHNKKTVAADLHKYFSWIKTFHIQSTVFISPLRSRRTFLLACRLTDRCHVARISVVSSGRCLSHCHAGFSPCYFPCQWSKTLSNYRRFDGIWFWRACRCNIS